MKKYLIVLLLVVPGCRKVSIGSEFSVLQKRTLAGVNSTIVLDNKLHATLADMPALQQAETTGLTRSDVVRIALLNNPSLQADFQTIGVAKSDVQQAGLYHNPTIDSVFRFPTKSGSIPTQPNIETTAAFRLSDLWQVPLTKHVAQDLLEIVTLRILTTILNLVADTKMAYNDCLALEAKLKNLAPLRETLNGLKEEIIYRQQYGYSSDLDISDNTARLALLDNEIEQQKIKLATAFMRLKKLMGIDPTPDPLALSDTMQVHTTVPPLHMLEEYAMANRPEIQIARMKIQQYEHSITLEKAKMFQDVDLGISFKQDFEKPLQGWGPAFKINLPIFDDNYAQVARMQFLLKQAEQELQAQKILVQEEIRTAYNKSSRLVSMIKQFEATVIPAYKQSIEYAQTHVQTMQLSMLVSLEAQIKSYEAIAELIDTQHDLMKNYAQLERAIGKDIFTHKA